MLNQFNQNLIAVLQEYYQSDRPAPAHYRHSQNDLTEWDENNHNTREMNHQRRSGPSDREHHYSYRNGSRDKEEWDENERIRPRYIDKFSSKNAFYQCFL